MSGGTFCGGDNHAYDTALLPEREFLITIFVYCGVSLLSLIVVTTSVVYNVLVCCKGSSIFVERFDGLFLLISITVGAFVTTNSFQWILLFEAQSPSTITCTVISAVYIYSLCALGCVVACIGCHLFLLVKLPKCLQVIKEARIRRLRLIELCYFIITALLPLAFVPFKLFIDKRYGEGYGRSCWINVECRQDFRWLLEPIILLSTTTLLWLFSATAIIVVVGVLCLYSKKLGNPNVYALLCLSLCYVVGFVIGCACVISISYGPEPNVHARFAIQLIKAFRIPLPCLIASIVLMARIYYIIVASRKKLIYTTINDTHFRTWPSEVSPLISSDTHYRPENEE